ncbi:hypothetical protein AAVH_22846 [Aphelenchoides avenae]|nr:hypothetical protein AAVH_22846 [Aphelenchus avenae]
MVVAFISAEAFIKAKLPAVMELRRAVTDLLKAEIELSRAVTDLLKAKIELRRAVADLLKADIKLRRAVTDLLKEKIELRREVRELHPADRVSTKVLLAAKKVKAALLELAQQRAMAEANEVAAVATLR